MADFIPNSDGLMRSTLRDTIRRLRRIRAKAGREEEQVELATSDDPFQDLANAFIRLVTRTKANINERNEGTRVNGQDRMAIEQSSEIRKDIRQLELYLQEMQTYLEDATARLGRENAKKKPKKHKVELLTRLVAERRQQYDDCVATVQLVKEMDSERVQLGKKEINAAKEMQLGKKAQLREQLASMRRRRGELDAGGNASGADGGSEFVDNTVGGGRLEQNAATSEQMKLIATQDAKIDAGLDRLREGVGRLHNLAVEIGGQLSMQNEMLDKTENMVDRQTRQLRDINRRLTRFMKESKPMNCFFNICCFALIVAVIGFFLLQFNVI